MAGCDGEGAWAMTGSRPAVNDPEAWKISGGQLCVNCSRGAYEKESMDIPGHILKKADAIRRARFNRK